VPPLSEFTQLLEGDPTRIQCARDCQTGLWIVDGGSPFVRHVLSRPYAIACGPARGGRPPLAVATRAQPSDAAAASDGDPAGANSAAAATGTR
jgi:hypothetical protein